MSRGPTPFPEWDQELRRFDRRDLWAALILYVLLLGWLALVGVVGYADTFSPLWFALAELALIGGYLAVVLRLRRQPWSSVGLTRRGLYRSIRLGALPMAVGLIGAFIIGALDGEPVSFHPELITFAVPYYLIGIGFTEELFFRGFLTPRLVASFRRPWVGGVLAGVLFALSHVPFRLAMEDFDLVAILPFLAFALPITFGWHFVLWWLYARHNNLAAPTLFHFFMNYSSLLI